jgi:hypothetical protein
LPAEFSVKNETASNSQMHLLILEWFLTQKRSFHQTPKYIYFFLGGFKPQKGGSE